MMFQSQVAVFVLAATALAFGPTARAEKFSTACPEIAACAKTVGALLGQNYVFTPDIKGKLEATDTLELTPANAEVLFTKLLEANGYSRVPIIEGDGKTFQILRQREARDSSVPVFIASKTQEPNLPSTWDLVTLKYKLAYPNAADMIARTLRSFLPATSRIIPSELGRMIIITCSAPDAKRMYASIRELDEKPSPDLLKQQREWSAMKPAQSHPGKPGLPPTRTSE